ncbi:OmpP1/FadL family transporter [Thiomicrorhabdus sediminis]|uniref:Aromatic hydrocarbon degradation protein n=1 Tax=Thiomicrorhabdus sediminis TaxID=2580412 RepID=A0A4P9K6T7_9GAMM|nr:outer membrane protein transport protein [Thiomicrorhabdus sediminis]QCU90729.1 aromatic hydrocarbon degradation protein [Thiomicrorhabdus sediminis]
MRKTKLALAVTSAIFASSAMATNGTNMTGVGAQANAMGGTGVAAYYGAENTIVNPAMVAKSQGTEFAFGGTVFMPNVQSTTDNLSNAMQSSDADLNLIPSVSMSTRINDNWSFGIGMYGTSGMGVDYGTQSALALAQTTMQIMRFVPTIAYNNENYGFGLSPVIQYGALDISFNAGSAFGPGMAQDIGYGLDLGAYIDISKDTTLALAYQSEIEMTYKGQLNSTSGAASKFGLTGFTDKIAQPSEIKVGIAHKMGNYTLTADAKQVRWGQAAGYKDFGWEDQNVFGLGVKYNGNGYWMGAGYNKGDNPIAVKADTRLNMLNNLFFPATTDTHLSVGGGYNISKNAVLEGAVVYAPEIETTVSIAGTGLGNTSTTKHSQLGYTVSVRYNF